MSEETNPISFENLSENVPEKRTFRSVTCALLWACLYLLIWLGCSFAVELFVGIVFFFFNPSLCVADLTDLLTKNNITITLLANLITLGILFLVSLIRKHRFADDVSLYPRPFIFYSSSVLLGLSASSIMAILLGLLTTVVPESWVAKQEATYATVTSNPLSFINILTVGIVAPVLEEILFRGLILNVLKKQMPAFLALALSSIAFGLVHGTAIAIIYATVLGFFLGFLALRCRSILPSILFHMAYNAFQLWMDEFTIAEIAISVVIFALELSFIIKVTKKR